MSRRAAVLAALLLVVGIAVAPFLRAAVSQDAEIAALERDVQQRRERVAQLEQQVERWEDPAFVKAQARQRLKYVMPGEVGYIVLDEDGGQDGEPTRTELTVRDVAESERPWFGTLWESVQQAGEPEADRPGPAVEQPDPVEPAPAPAPVPAP